MNILDLVRPDLKDFRGYSSAANELSDVPSIKLDANESPYPPFGTMGEACQANLYSEPQPTALRQRLANLWGFNAEQILLTSGSGQGIDLLIRLFCQEGKDEIIICPPTFPMYAVCARIQGAGVRSISLLQNGQLDVEEILKQASPSTKLVFIPTPNAPMGHGMNGGDILRLCKALSGRCVVVADEAYIDFSTTPDGLSLSLIDTPNLVLLRTLSKSFALAGERIGCVISTPDLIPLLRAVSPPYPLSQSAIRIAMDTLSPCGLLQKEIRVRQTVEERERLRRALEGVASIIRIYPSEGNFLFIETRGGHSFLSNLRRLGISVRDMSSQRANCIRISIGSPDENNILLRALDVTDSNEGTASRVSSCQRKTNETIVEATIDLDTTSKRDISTGIGFLDHMIDQIAAHGGFSLGLRAQGDLNVDQHHTIEDCAIVLGEVIRKALGHKSGIGRFGFTAPLDESVANVVIDLSGRPYTSFNVNWPLYAGDGISPDLVEHFLRSFAVSLNATMQISASGENNHHVIEAIFKSLGRALRQAVRIEGKTLPSTKGVL